MPILNPEIKRVLEDCVSPERGDLLGDIVDFLTEIGNETHDFAFQAILSRYDSLDPAMLIAEIETTLEEITDNLLTQHDILMVDHELKPRHDLLVTLYGIPRYGDPQSIIDIIDADTESAESRMADLTTLFTENEVGEEILEAIVEVKYELLDVIREMAIKALDDSTDISDAALVDEFPQVQIIRQRFIDFTKKNTKTFAVTELIRQGYGFGLDYDLYLERTFEVLRSIPSPVDVVKELYAIALASSLDSTDFIPTIEEHIPSFTSLTNNRDLIETVINDVAA